MLSIQKQLNTSRDAIKGFAILWVVFLHAKLGLSGALYDVQKIGYGGVDIFLFLSGYGLYRSLNRDHDLGAYLKRRAARLLPAYGPFCLIWLAVMLPLYGGGAAASIRIVAGNATMLGFFADAPLMINWYVSMILLTVLAAPVLYACLRPGKRYWLRAALLMSGLFVFGAAYIGNDQYMAFSRLPVFVLGMIFARPYEKNRCGSLIRIGLLCAGVAALAVLYVCFARYPELLNDYAMYWHPFVVIAPALCLGLGWLFAKLPSWFGAFFAVPGRASFEIFLFNAWIEVLGKKYGLAQTPLQWAFWSVAAIAAGLLYHRIVGKIVQKVVDNRA